MTIVFLGRVVVEDIFCWTDSRVALSWICGKEKQWEAWVENRVVNIRKIVDRTKWHFVRGDENQAEFPPEWPSISVNVPLVLGSVVYCYCPRRVLK